MAHAEVHIRQRRLRFEIDRLVQKRHGFLLPACLHQLPRQISECFMALVWVLLTLETTTEQCHGGMRSDEVGSSTSVNVKTVAPRGIGIAGG